MAYDLPTMPPIEEGKQTIRGEDRVAEKLSPANRDAIAFPSRLLRMADNMTGDTDVPPFGELAKMVARPRGAQRSGILTNIQVIPLEPSIPAPVDTLKSEENVMPLTNHSCGLTAYIIAGFAALIFPAAAATSVGSQHVEDGDMIIVQIHCKNLSAAQSPEQADTTSPGWTASGGAAGPEAGAVAGSTAGGPIAAPVAGEGGAAGSTMGADDAPNVDLRAITLEDCKAAGLIN